MGNTQNNDTTAIISRMKEALDVTSDVALCRKLGSKSTGLVGNWRKTGVVPDGAIAKASQISERPVEWFKTGEGKTRLSPAGTGHIDPALAQAIAKKLKAKYEGKAIELTGEELMAVQMLRDLSDHDRQRIMHMLQMAWTSGKVEQES